MEIESIIKSGNQTECRATTGFLGLSFWVDGVLD